MMRKTKILVDVVMYIMLLYLMSYRAGRGLFLHSLLGCMLFALFLLHHALNLRWYRGIVKGKCTFTKAVFLLVNFLLLADMAVLAVSSVQMSGDVFAFSPFPATQQARDLHFTGAAWGFVLTGLHIGLHTQGMFSVLHRKVKDTFFGYTYVFLFFLAFAAGIFCFVHSGLWKNMFMLPQGGRAFEDMQFLW